MFPFFNSQKTPNLQEQINWLIQEYKIESDAHKKQTISEKIKELVILIYNQNNLNYFKNSQYQPYLIN